MKQHTRQIISILLAVAMVLALAACGSTGSTSGTGSTGNTSSAGSASTGGTGSMSTPPAEPITLTIGIPTNARVETYEDNKFTLWLEEQTGYNLEFSYFSSSSSEYKSQLAASVSGGDKLPDILWGFSLSAQERAVYGNDGYFIDLSPYFEDDALMAEYDWKTNLNEKFSQAYVERVYSEGIDPATGEWYGFPHIAVSRPDVPANMVYINQVWLDKLGLDMPTTYEEFVEVLRAFKTQDPNGNGKSDEIPAVGATVTVRSDLPSWIINNWVYVNDKYLFNVNDAGEVWLPYTTDEYREGLRALNQLVEEGLLSTLTWTIASSSELPTLYTPTSNVAQCGVWAGHLLLRVVQDSPLVYEYQPLAPFNYAALEAEGLNFRNFITADCEHPEEAFRLLLTMASEEGSMRQRYGEYGVDWEYGIDPNDGYEGVKVLEDAFGGQTDSTWGATQCAQILYVKEYILSKLITDPDLSWDDYRNVVNEDHANQYLTKAEENNPDVIIYNLLYSTEEMESNGTIQTDVTDYIKNARAQFAAGVLDIDSDKDWNSYVANLNALGIETLLKNAQAAYDRTK